MAARSPTQNHAYWGAFATTADLPNVAASTTQKSTLEAGDQAYVAESLYVCTDATLGAAVWVAGAGAPNPTYHLYQGDITNVQLGVPNTPTPIAMRTFGQINMHTAMTIAVIHAHWIVVPNGGGSVTIEVYRARGVLTGGPITWVKIAVLTTAATNGTFMTTAVVPAPANVEKDDYLFAQMIEKNNGFEGLTLDVHFLS